MNASNKKTGQMNNGQYKMIEQKIFCSFGYRNHFYYLF